MTALLIKRFFQKHPIIANSSVYGFLYVGAEFSQQVVTKKILVKENEEAEIDKKTLARYLFVGSVINSNYLYAWYKWLDGKYIGTSSKIVFKKLLLDQFVMTPPLYVIFYVTMNILEGKKDLFEECKTKFPKTFLISCLFWIPAQTFNFIFLPSAARVVYLGLCSFVWVNILCWIKRSNVNQPQKLFSGKISGDE